MKLAEALLERKALMDKVGGLRQRLSENVLVQEGDEPSEQPEVMLRDLEEAVAQLEGTIKRINSTNNTARLPDDTTVSEAIVHRDMLNLRRQSIEQAANMVSARQNRYTRSEVKFVATVSASDLRKRVDELAKQHRELDAQIQAVNWTAELVDAGS